METKDYVQAFLLGVCSTVVLLMIMIKKGQLNAILGFFTLTTALITIGFALISNWIPAVVWGVAFVYCLVISVKYIHQ